MEVVVFSWLLCGLLGAIVGSFRKAIVVGGILGIVLGPLGVIIAFAADNRTRCPECAAPVAEGRLNCEKCRAPLKSSSRKRATSETVAAGLSVQTATMHARRTAAATDSALPSKPAGPPSLWASLIGAVGRFTKFLDTAARRIGGEEKHNVLSMFVKVAFYILLVIVLVAQIAGSFERVGHLDTFLK